MSEMTLAEVGTLAQAIRAEIAKAVVGQAGTVDHLLVLHRSLLSRQASAGVPPKDTDRPFLSYPVCKQGSCVHGPGFQQ